MVIFCFVVTPQVVFEGVRGTGYEGDIAIDDVSITTGKCKQDNTVSNTGTEHPALWLPTVHMGGGP